MRRKIYREDIINTGLELMFSKGYHAVSIKEITESVAIPKGSFYNHFSSKEEFGLIVVKAYCDNGIRMYEEKLLNKKYRPIRRIENFFNDLIKVYENQMDFKFGCIMGNFSIELADVNEKFRKLLKIEFERCENVFKECLDEAFINEEISSENNSKTMASFILNSWQGALLRMKSTGDSVPLKDCRDMILKQLK